MSRCGTKVRPRTCRHKSEKAIERYVDESYAKSLAVLPLRRPKSADQAREASTGNVERDQEGHGEVIGALIIEQIESDIPRNIVAPRIDLVYEHSARALANSMEHSRLFLMPVWRTLGRAAWVVRARTLPKTLTIAALLLIAICVLTFVQWDFYLKSKGALQPSIKQEVFVSQPGIVDAVHVEDQALVEEGQPLLTLRTPTWKCSWKMFSVKSSPPPSNWRPSEIRSNVAT